MLFLLDRSFASLRMTNGHVDKLAFEFNYKGCLWSDYCLI